MPARDIDSVEVLGHLSDHDRVETAIREASLAGLEVVLQCVPQLLAHLVVGILLLDRAALGDDLLSSERTTSVAPSAVRPPLLDGLDLGVEGCLLGFERVVVGHACSEIGGVGAYGTESVVYGRVDGHAVMLSPASVKKWMGSIGLGRV